MGQGFKILLRYLDQHLTDSAVYPKATRAATRKTIGRLGFAMLPVLDDDVYDRLGDRVVEYYRRYGSKPHQKNPQLLR